MYSIDKIMQMLDSSYEKNNSEEVQNKGIELGKEVKFFDIFFQPKYPSGKMVWENCAKIICDKTNEELEPYLDKMFEWVEDLNWPGALLIFERLVDMAGSGKYEKCKNDFIQNQKILGCDYVIDTFLEYESYFINRKKKVLTNPKVQQNNYDLVIDIDEIIKMLDKNNSEEVQKNGIELAKEVKCLDAFIIYKQDKFRENILENCAKIICNRADEELKDYIFHLFYYLKDLTIPGALLIFERLKRMKVTYNSLYSQAKEIILRDAKVLNDKKWIDNIKKIDSNYKYDDLVVM